MGRPNFYLKATIARELRGVEILHHTALPAKPFTARHVSISVGYSHTVNVRVGKVGMFEMRWHANSDSADTLPRWYLASKVWAYRQQMNEVQGKAA